MSIKIIENANHENWICTVETVNGTTNYYMEHRTYRYMLSIQKFNGEWWAELLTRQTILGSVSWEPAHNNFNLRIEDAKAEVERRGAYHSKKVWS